MNDHKESVARGFVWVVLFASGATVCAVKQDAWTVVPMWACIGFAGLAVLYTLFQILLLIMSGLTHGMMAVPGLLFGGALWAARGLALIGDGHSALFRFYGFRRAFAILLGGLVALAGGMLAVAIGSPAMAIFPVGLGLIVTFLPDLSERVKAIPAVERMWLVGGEPREAPPKNLDLRKMSGSIKKDRHGDAGYVSSKLYLGDTLPEHTGVPKMVFTNDPGCIVSWAMVGAGKFVSDVAMALAMSRGSIVFVSTKGEGADTFCGRGCDPAMHEGLAQRLGVHPGIDARGHTKVDYYIPHSRSFVCDPGGETGFESSNYPFLHEIDTDDVVTAVALIGLIATALLPDNPKASDPYWRNMARRLIRFLIGVVVTTQPHDKRNLVGVVELLKGIDAGTGRADPTKLRDLFLKGLSNPDLNGTIQSDASDLFKASDKQLGSIVAEAGNALDWVLTMRKHLSGKAQFSYRELGDDTYPVRVFIVPQSIDKAAGASYMRLHAAVAAALIVKRPVRPKTPTIMICDEAPQYISGSGIPDLALVARAANFKIHLLSQNYPALLHALGEDVLESFLSSSTEKFYGVNDTKTARRLIELLGERTSADGKREKVVTVQDIINRDLSITSPLMYVKPYAGPMMKLMRRSFVSINTSQGLKIKALPLAGHFDTHLSKYS